MFEQYRRKQIAELSGARNSAMISSGIADRREGTTTGDQVPPAASFA
jgi:hypothetical protein